MSYLDKLKRFEKSPTSAERQPATAPTITTLTPESITIELSATNANLVYWEAVTGRILGPATVTSLAQVVALDGRESFWLCVNYRDSWRWVHESRLRTANTGHTSIE